MVNDRSGRDDRREPAESRQARALQPGEINFVPIVGGAVIGGLVGFLCGSRFSRPTILPPACRVGWNLTEYGRTIGWSGAGWVQ